jgi:hypothetical protein
LEVKFVHGIAVIAAGFDDNLSQGVAGQVSGVEIAIAVVVRLFTADLVLLGAGVDRGELSANPQNLWRVGRTLGLLW